MNNEEVDTSKALTAEDIFGIKSELEILKIDQWKGHFYMSTFSGTDRAKFQTKCSTKNLNTGEGSLDLQIWVIILGICDKDGKAIFKEDRETIKNLKAQNGAVIESVAKSVLQFNALGEVEKEVEAEAKN